MPDPFLIYRQHLWNNDEICVGGNPIYFVDWHRKGVMFVNDLLDDNGGFYSYDKFISLYNIQTNFITYYGIIHCIRMKWPGCFNKGWKYHNPLSPTYLDVFIKTKFGCKCFSEIFTLDCRPDVLSSKSKWEIVLPA